VVLGEGADGATVSEVASRIGVTLPATSRQLRRLARRGLVAVAPDDRDRRAARARLTDLGLETRAAILAYRIRLITDQAAAMKVHAATLADLRKIAAAFDRYR
jgi:DNA-binding MarR family transcriptional regulator